MALLAVRKYRKPGFPRWPLAQQCLRQPSWAAAVLPGRKGVQAGSLAHAPKELQWPEPGTLLFLLSLPALQLLLFSRLTQAGGQLSALLSWLCHWWWPWASASRWGVSIRTKWESLGESQDRLPARTFVLWLRSGKRFHSWVSGSRTAVLRAGHGRGAAPGHGEVWCARPRPPCAVSTSASADTVVGGGWLWVCDTSAFHGGRLPGQEAWLVSGPGSGLSPLECPTGLSSPCVPRCVPPCPWRREVDCRSTPRSPRCVLPKAGSLPPGEIPLAYSLPLPGWTLGDITGAAGRGPSPPFLGTGWRPGGLRALRPWGI